MRTSLHASSMRVFFVPTLLGLAGCPTAKQSTDVSDRLEALESEVSVLREDVESLQTANEAKDAEIAALQGQVAALGTVDEALDGRVSALEAGDEDTGALAELTDRVTTLEGQGLDGRLATVEADYATATDLGALDARVSLIEGDYATGSALTAVDGRLTSVEGSYATTSDLAATDGRVDSILADYATQSWVLGQLDDERANAAAVYLTLSDAAAMYLTIDDAETSFVSSVLFEVAAVQIYSGPSTLEIPSAEYPDLNAALDYLDGYHIPQGTTVTLQLVASATYSEAVEVSHPDGARIVITGDTSDPASVVLTFNGVDGFVVRDGHALGRLEGLTITTPDSGGYVSGIHALNGADIGLGSGIVVTGFWYGIHAEGSSVIGPADDEAASSAGWLTVSGCAGGVFAESASTATVPFANIAVRDGGGGIHAHESSHIDASNVLVTGGYNGIVATGSSYVNAEYSDVSVTDASATGIQVGAGSAVDANRASVEALGGYGLHVSGGGIAYMIEGADLDGGTADIYQDAHGLAWVSGVTVDSVSNNYNDTDDYVIGN